MSGNLDPGEGKHNIALMMSGLEIPPSPLKGDVAMTPSASTDSDKVKENEVSLSVTVTVVNLCQPAQNTNRIQDHLTPPRSPVLGSRTVVSRLYSLSYYAKIWGVALRALSKVRPYERLGCLSRW